MEENLNKVYIAKVEMTNNHDHSDSPDDIEVLGIFSTLKEANEAVVDHCKEWEETKLSKNDIKYIESKPFDFTFGEDGDLWEGECMRVWVEVKEVKNK